MFFISVTFNYIPTKIMIILRTNRSNIPYNRYISYHNFRTALHLKILFKQKHEVFIRGFILALALTLTSTKPYRCSTIENYPS